MDKRWIDANQLIADLKEYVEKIKNIRDDDKCFLTEENVLSIIDEQSTIFDVDKICEQLQENSVMMGTSKCAFDYPPDKKYIEEVVKIRTAFEIVERGGMDEV